MSYTTRTADWVIQKAWSEAKGKATPPTSGTPKYNQLLTLTDTELKNWEAEEDIEWDSLYGETTIGTVTATDTFPLSTSIQFISKREGDSIYLQSADGTQKQELTLVRPNQLFEYRDSQLYVAQKGRNLVFSKAFDATSSFLGFSIIVPSYTYTNEITTGTDIVNCDDPLYIAYMVAASYARNDLIKSGQYQNIIDKATVRMNKMKQQNSGQREELDRVFDAAGETWS